jgi:hypothetical protein
VSYVARKWAEGQPLPRKAGVLLFHIADFANDDGKAWPDQDKLATRTGWAKGTIKRWTDFNRDLGLLSTRKRFNRRKGYCDALEYTLHLDRAAPPEEVQGQIAKLRFGSAQGKSQKQGFASPKANRKNAGGKSQLAANNLIEPQGPIAAASAPPAHRLAASHTARPEDSEASPHIAAREGSLGGAPAHGSDREGHEHEDYQGNGAERPVRRFRTAAELIANLERDFRRCQP